MGEPIEIFGDTDSGNCVKVLLAAVRAGEPFRWHAIDTAAVPRRRHPEVDALNPAGQVPVMRLSDGRVITQSGAISTYLLRETPLVPGNAFDRAKMLEWMFWEQYSHEPYIAVCRSQMRYEGRKAAERDAWRVAKGEAALDVMERVLGTRDWIAEGAGPSAADIALMAYTRVAHQGGFDLRERPSLRRWLARCEAEFGAELGVLEWISAGNDSHGL